jgi:restriction system protein
MSAMPMSLTVLIWATAIGAIALAALIDVMGRAQRLHRQRALADLAALTWQQFEEVIADAFRRHGYRVREVGGWGRADGGVDLLLTRDGETTIVQAKHWCSQRVGVQLVRELYGVQHAMQAERSMFVAMGRYTADAQQFAAQVGMSLVDGEELLRIIGAGLAGAPLVLQTPAPTSAPMCPACGGDMVRRTARRGPRAGAEFFGCAQFPACRGTAAVPEEAAGVS